MELIKKWSENYVEAGCDEVGRGCLCGPVVAAAVVLDDNFEQNLVNDSKKLNFKTRLELDDYIKNNVKIMRLQNFRQNLLTNTIFLMQAYMLCIMLLINLL